MPIVLWSIFKCGKYQIAIIQLGHNCSFSLNELNFNLNFVTIEIVVWNTLLRPIITAYVDITIPGCTQISGESVFVTNISLQPWIRFEMNSQILTKIKSSWKKSDLQSL